MPMTLIPVNEPLISGNAAKYVAECVESGWVSSEGRFIGEFEETWANFCGGKAGVAVNSGTAALEIAVAALEMEPGSEVILPSYTIISCAMAVIAGGGVPFDPGAELTGKPHVVLVVGVNGVGKTTTIGKLARLYRDSGQSVLLAACDTFRAAAVPQLEIWAERAGADIVRAQQGADPAAVAFDAVSAALSRDTDVVLVDTAGRLHTKVNLMEELKKIRRSLGKQCLGAPHETLLVLDATTGQNALSQARQFHLATEVTGLVLTKLDGTAKGGIAFALRRELGIPIKLIGVGEGEDDLQPFDGETFVEALLER